MARVSSSISISRRMMISSSSSTTLNPVAVQLELIKSKNWQMIRTLIAVLSPDYFRGMASSISSYSEQKLNSMTLLHVIAKQNPPPDIVGIIIKLCPEMAAARDDLGRTPLHIAAGSGASPLLLKSIASAYPAACEAQDEDGRTPLHFACDTSATLYAEDIPSSTPQHKKQPDHEAIVALLSESLNAAAIEDDDEMSPLEHAIMCDASLETVMLLQASASKSLRSNVRPASPNPANKRRRVLSLLEDASNCSGCLHGINIKRDTSMPRDELPSI